MHKEFIEFIKQYGIIGLAIAVIIGGKLNALVSSLVDGLLMPLVLFFIPGGTWRTATLDVGPFHFLPGPILGAFVDFTIVAIVVFLMAKWILREAKVAKK
ncbi:MAG: MscL family protein [Bacteroidota bacterium]